MASIAPSGTAHFSPQCSAWIRMCVHHTERDDDDPLGQESRLDVREANFCASVLSGGGVESLATKPRPRHPNSLRLHGRSGRTVDEEDEGGEREGGTKRE
eukprot:5973474-Pyramimonas_sp.AAC.2